MIRNCNLATGKSIRFKDSLEQCMFWCRQLSVSLEWECWLWYDFWQFNFFLSLDKVLGAITTAAERNNRERFSPVVEGLENHEFLQLQVGLVVLLLLFVFLIYAHWYFCVLFSNILHEEMGVSFFLTFKIWFCILTFSRNHSQKFIWIWRILLSYSSW